MKTLPKELQEVVEKLGVAIIFKDENYKPTKESIETARQSLVSGGWCGKPPSKTTNIGNLLVFFFEDSDGFENVAFGAATKHPKIKMILGGSGMNVALWPAILKEQGY